MWDSITLIIIFNSLHNDFEIIIALLLYLGDKDFEKIQ